MGHRLTNCIGEPTTVAFETSIEVTPLSEYSIALEEQLQFARWFDARPANMTVGQHKLLTASARQRGTYFWSRTLNQLLVQCANTLPQWQLHADMLFTPHGFVHFQEPVKADDLGITRRGSVRSLLWARFQTESGAGISLTAHLAGDGEFFSTLDQPEGLGVDLESTLIPFGTGFEQALTSEATNERNAGIYARLFASMMLLVSQRLLSTSHHPAGRATRHRIARSNAPVDSLIRVVELRRKVGRSGDPESRSVEWACRWWVRGHWRWQLRPSLGRHQWTWVRAHVKGPDHRPIRAPHATVFAVVR
jgi:hypothetical protein